MLVSMKEILAEARNGKYGVAAPNVINEDTARVCIEAAVEMRAPLILDIAYQFHPDIISLGKIICMLAQTAAVPIAVNLDHGASFEQAIWAIRAGFTSIMVDRSSAPYEDNIRDTAELVKIAHAVGVSVEAELGHVGDGVHYAQDREQGLTDPAKAREYADRTGIDCLAVAIGTAHGAYSGEPHLDFERLKAIGREVDIPLVLHGGSGSGNDNLVKAIQCGITKINIATDLFVAGVAAGAQEGPPYMIYHRIREGYKQRLKGYMELFGQSGRAG